jgi:hypothetical protein
LLAILPLLALAAAPAWWTNRGVLEPAAPANDYASVNQGQLKNIAKAAVQEMDSRLPGGAGETLHALIHGWSTAAARPDDFGPVNLGQLKTVAKPFYDRLIAVGYVLGYPWTASSNPAEDYAAANIGQVKNLFKFDLTAVDPIHDADGNGLPDWWERHYFGGAIDPTGDFDGDGATNLREFSDGTDPGDPYNGQTPPSGLGVEPRELRAQLGRWHQKTLPILLSNSTAQPVSFSVSLHGNTTTSYRFEDSRGGEVPFVWEDISATGARLGFISNADDDFEEVTLSQFAFPFFGQTHSSLFVSANGFVTFGEGRDDARNTSLPFGDAPMSLIAAFWDDLNPRARGDIYYQEEHDRLIIQFQDVARYGGDGFVTFQIVLFADGQIEMRYLDLRGILNSCTVGVQDSSTTNGLEVVYNQPYLESNLAIRISSGAAFLDVTPTQGTIPPNGTAQLNALFSASDLKPGSYDAEVAISHDGPGETILLPALLEVVALPAGVSITSPANGSGAWEGQSLVLTATVSDPDRVMERIEFYAGETFLGNGVAGQRDQFRFSWDRIPAGTNVVTSKAIARTGQVFASEPITLVGMPDLDEDGDGLRSSQEAAAGTNPSNRDSDGDGLSDGEEAQQGTNPVSRDSDRDGIDDRDDGWPVHKQLSPATIPECRYVAIKVGSGYARGVNNSGQVVGQSSRWDNTNPNQAVLWQVGKTPVYLDDLTNDGLHLGRSSAAAINNAGLISGFTDYAWDTNVTGEFPNPPTQPYLASGGAFHACVWEVGKPTRDLNDLSLGQTHDPAFPDPSNKGRSEALAINQAGTVVGCSTSKIEVGLSSGQWTWEVHADLNRAVRFGVDGAPIQLPVPAHPAVPSEANAINDHGAIAGSGAGSEGRNAFLLSSGQVHLIDPGSNSSPASASGVNNLDHVIGNFGVQGAASLWVNRPDLPANERFVNLATLPTGANISNPGVSAINDRDQIVGTGRRNGQDEAILWQNGKAFALTSLVTNPPEPGWRLFSATAISQNGLIVANAGDWSDSEAYLLIPAELTVDADRDGEIIMGKDTTSEQRRFRFWLNNDHDEERTVDGNDREQDDYNETPDFDNPAVPCERDLEDWARLRISFKGIVGLIKSPGITLELAWKPTNGGTTWPASDGNPSIKVMLHDSLAGAGDAQATYLTEKSKASAQANGIWGGVIRPVSKSGGYVLTNDFLQFVTEEEPYLHLLFEGWTAGKGQLVLNIKKGGEKIGEYPPLYLELKDVKDMYQRYTVGDVQDADTSVFSPVDYQHWPDNHATLMPTPSGHPFVTPPDETKDYVLWVHGWNMSPFDKDSFADTAFKRLFWQGYKGRFGVFRWPTFHFTSDVPPVHHFDASEHRAWVSSLGLLSLLNQLNSGPFNGKVRIMAHSMGNIVAGEALRRAQSGQVVHTYVASQAAISAHCYDAAAPRMQFYTVHEIPRGWVFPGSPLLSLGPTTPNVYGYYWQTGVTSQPHQWESEGQPSYMHSDYMSGKAGHYFNYYNDLDWALTWPRWQLNQQTKPDADYGYENSGSGASQGFWRDRGLGATWLTFPTDRYEIFSWVAESQSYSLGAQWVSGIIIGSEGENINLRQPPFNFDREHKYHSGQFRGMNMERHYYWEQFLIDCGLKEAR